MDLVANEWSWLEFVHVALVSMRHVCEGFASLACPIITTNIRNLQLL